MVETHVLRFRRTLKNVRWSILLGPYTTARLIMVPWFWDVKARKLY